MRFFLKKIVLTFACIILFLMHVSVFSSLRANELTVFSSNNNTEVFESTDKSDLKFIKQTFQNISGIDTSSSLSSKRNNRTPSFKKSSFPNFTWDNKPSENQLYYYIGKESSIHLGYLRSYSKEYYVLALNRLII